MLRTGNFVEVVGSSVRDSCLRLPSFRAFRRFPRRTPISLPLVWAIVELAPQAAHNGVALQLLVCRQRMQVQRVIRNGTEGERFGGETFGDDGPDQELRRVCGGFGMSSAGADSLISILKSRREVFRLFLRQGLA